MQIKLILALILALILVIFAVQNPIPIKLRFLNWESSEISLVIVILLTALGGAIIAGVLSLFSHFQLKGIIRKQEKTIRMLEEELKMMEKAVREKEEP